MKTRSHENKLNKLGLQNQCEQKCLVKELTT